MTPQAWKSVGHELFYFADGEARHGQISTEYFAAKLADAHNAAVRDAEAAMRERCARVAESRFSALDAGDQGFVRSVAETIAVAIRGLQ